MKKNSEKKINWKKVAAFGGVFVLGETTPCMFMGKRAIKLVLKSDKTGIALPMKMPRSSVEDMLDMIDGTLTMEKFFSR